MSQTKEEKRLIKNEKERARYAALGETDARKAGKAKNMAAYRTKVGKDHLAAAQRKFRKDNPGYNKIACRKHQQANPGKYTAACLKWNADNPEKAKASATKSRKKHRVARAASGRAAYALLTPEQRRAKMRHDYANQSDETRLKRSIRSAVNTSIRRNGYKKTSKTYDILGCDYDALIAHLHKSGKANYGDEYTGNIRDYHRDHIIPLDSAKKDLPKFLTLMNYENMQLLTPEHNNDKRARLDWVMPK